MNNPTDLFQSITKEQLSILWYRGGKNALTAAHPTGLNAPVMKTFLRNLLVIVGIATLFVATALPVEAGRTGGSTVFTTPVPKPVVSAF